MEAALHFLYFGGKMIRSDPDSARHRINVTALKKKKIATEI